MTSGLVSVTIVTYNSSRYIERCLRFLFEQDYPAMEIIVVDNASGDGTPEILHRFQSRIAVVCNQQNKGFAGGQNQAIALTSGEWVLVLNPDVRLTPNFLTNAMAAGRLAPEIGSVSGKLRAMQPSFEIPTEQILDSTGIHFTPSLRHFDRGSKQRDDGQYEKAEYVFGVTGAAAFYRRTMIEDVSINGEFFDDDFFAYREDADLSWRAQLLGWKCVYTPHALAYHVRSVLPANRRSVPALVNMHSVKNRFLMRVKNVTGPLYWCHFWAITGRDLMVVAGCLLREWPSLRAFSLVLKLFGRTWSKRREIMRRRRVSEGYLAAWFQAVPARFEAAELAVQLSPSKELKR